MVSSIRHSPKRVATNAELAAGTRLSSPGALWASVAEHPYAYDWFFVLRWQEARDQNKPRYGRASRATDESVRVAQKPSLLFPPASIASVSLHPDRVPTLFQYGFGLFGANGPMPLHFTELAYERENYSSDRSITAFADIFHHRAAMLFYRAWADTESTVSLDRPGSDYERYSSSLASLGGSQQQRRDRVPDHAKRYFSGHMVRQTRNPEGLERILGEFFSTNFRVEPWKLTWLVLPTELQTQLGKAKDTSRLGVAAVAGCRYPDRQHCFGLTVGPMSLKQYLSFLPNGTQAYALRDWVRNYVGLEFDWTARLTIRNGDRPQLALGGATQLGWTTWVGTPTKPVLDEFAYRPERISANQNCDADSTYVTIV